MMTFLNPLDALIPKIPFSFFFPDFWVLVTSEARGSVSVGFCGSCQLSPFLGRGGVQPEGSIDPPPQKQKPGLRNMLSPIFLPRLDAGRLCCCLCASGNCSTDIAAKIQWVYPPGECVTDGAISRMAVSCEEIYDYPSLDCTGTPIVNFTGQRALLCTRLCLW